jgi:hypothetical protein
VGAAKAVGAAVASEAAEIVEAALVAVVAETAAAEDVARLSCSLQFGVKESSFQAARLSSKQHRLIS